jgi:uncharacterized BrkB/YihY/UPF0761 family membrane protein
MQGKKGRLAYAGLASTTAFAFSMLFLFAQAMLSSVPIVIESFLYALLATFCGFIAAHLSWPKNERRSKWRMIFAGILTVALSFLFMGFLLGLFVALINNRGFSVIFVTPFFFLFFGSLLTFGLPYLIGALLSLLFANDRLESNPNESKL